MVERAFRHLDPKGTGAVHVSDILANYSTSKTKEFLNQFDGILGKADGVITKAEWYEFYSDLAMTIPNDDYFVAAVEATWAIAEEEQSKNFHDKIKQIIGMLRQRLLVLSNHCEEEFQLRKIFKSFDINQSGAITIDELSAMLAKLGISVERKYVEATLRQIDTNKNGMIEFEEFTTLVLYDPYK